MYLTLNKSFKYFIFRSTSSVIKLDRGAGIISRAKLSSILVQINLESLEDGITNRLVILIDDGSPADFL